ncbi:uncharacterized protein KD926_000622 [Aspergillus affinis]|uniref:uncharacterized protein n=1 Tax=Aspergillus affinis TaxID=1070780 RepID=UPI0022FE422A|nr:uncharacterized protein KD926_000622 [Aspergillus affinis]KAI9037335.1 hypothetical protein KD926_000622 [Aspergillus affinis]
MAEDNNNNNNNIKTIRARGPRLYSIHVRMMHLPSEIVLEILEILEYAEPHIAPFLRINTQWFRCGISLVWQRVTSPPFLRVPKHRRQIYASEIRHFSTQHFEEFGHLSWPKLESLCLNFLRRDKLALADIVSSLECYPGDRLRHLDLKGPFDPELLSFFTTSCPRLHSFSFSFPGPDLTPEAFLAFLQGTPSVSEIFIWSIGSPLVTSQTLNHLAGRKNLQFLSLDDDIGINTISAINEPCPFPHLQTLIVSVTEAALSSLVGMLRSVRKLSLTLVKPDDDEQNLYFDSIALRHISNLVELQDLKLFIMGEMRIRNEDLLSLKSLTQLKCLTIEGRAVPSLTAPSFEDANFEELFTNFPRLEDLNLRLFYSALSTDSLKSLGRCCPSLRLCNTMDVCDLAAFRYEKTPLFLNLELLYIDSFTNLERMFSWR